MWNPACSRQRALPEKIWGNLNQVWSLVDSNTHMWFFVLTNRPLLCKILTLAKSGWGHVEILCYLCNFSVNLELPQNTNLKPKTPTYKGTCYVLLLQARSWTRYLLLRDCLKVLAPFVGLILIWIQWHHLVLPNLEIKGMICIYLLWLSFCLRVSLFAHLPHSG